jgi:hypothetical protein
MQLCQHVFTSTAVHARAAICLLRYRPPPRVPTSPISALSASFSYCRALLSLKAQRSPMQWTAVFFFQGFLFVAKAAIINRKDAEEWAIDLRKI